MRKLLALFWIMVPVVAVDAAPIVPSVVLHGVETVSSGGDIMVDAIESSRVPSTPVRWQVVRPAAIPSGMAVLQLDSGGIMNAVLILRRPPDGSYLIAGTVYGSPDASGTPTAATAVVEITVGSTAKAPEPIPIPPTPTPTPQNPTGIVPMTTAIHAVYCYHLPDPSKTTQQDIAIAAIVASPTIRTALARLNVDWHAWDDNRPELASGSPMDQYFDKAKLPLMLAWSAGKDRKSVIYDAGGVANNPVADSAFRPSDSEAGIIAYFAKLRGQ